MLKSGDKVKCIDNKSLTSILVVGNHYTFLGYELNVPYKNRIRIKELPGLFFYEERFEYSLTENRKIKLKELYNK